MSVSIYVQLIKFKIDLMHKSSSGPCILGNKKLRLVIGHPSRGGPITMRKFPFPRLHGPDYDLCIRSIPVAGCKCDFDFIQNY